MSFTRFLLRRALAAFALLGLATAPALAQSTRTAEIVFVIDESGSMSGEQDFLQTFVPQLETQLLSAGLSDVLFGLTGFGNSAVVPRTFLIGGQQFGSAADWASAAGALEVSGGTEDGYAGIQYVLDNYTFSGGANTAVIVLVTDEDRDNTNNALTFNVILVNLQDANVSLSAIINQSILGPSNEVALATNGTVTYIDANNDGAPEETGAPTFGDAFGTTNADYTQLVLSFANGCVADLNQLRAGGTAAQAFAATLARCLVQQALGGSGQDQFLIAPSVVSRLSLLAHTDALLFRLSGRFGGYDGGMEAMATNGAGNRRGFALMSYTDGSVDAVIGQPGFDFDGSQLILGLDADLNDRVLVGGSIGFSNGESRAHGRSDSWKHDTVTLSAYASVDLGNDVQLDAIASVGAVDYKTRRAVVGGEAAIASPDGDVYAVRARLSKAYPLTVLGHGVDLTPHAGFTYTQVNVDGYQEQGPGAVSVAGFEHEETTLDLGVELQTTHAVQGGVLRPSLQLGVEYAANADDEVVAITTALGGGFSQTVRALDEWTGVVGVGATLIGDDDRFAVRAGYEGRFGDELEEHTFSIRGRWRF